LQALTLELILWLKTLKPSRIQYPSSKGEIECEIDGSTGTCHASKAKTPGEGKQLRDEINLDWLLSKGLVYILLGCCFTISLYARRAGREQQDQSQRADA
jgi:hypothetical protein